MPEGVHSGVITGLVDLGKQPSTNPQHKDAYKLALIVSFPSVSAADGQPMTVTAMHTNSMYKSANLRAFVEALFGKAFPTQEAADNFDLKLLVGRAGLFSVSHKTVGDKVFANIKSAMALPAGMPKPEADPAKFIVFDGTVTGSAYAESLARVPEWLQKKIANQIIERKGDLADEGDPQQQQGFDDDIPF